MNAEPTKGYKMKKTIKELDEARIKAHDAWEKAEKALLDLSIAAEEAAETGRVQGLTWGDVDAKTKSRHAARQAKIDADDALNAARLARKSIKPQSEDD
jgi:hypothetical protein